jgi:aspartyl protease family protein
MGTPKDQRPASNAGRTSFSYERVASRHRQRKSTSPLKSIAYLVAVVVAVVLVADKLRAKRSVPVPVAATTADTIVSHEQTAPPQPKFEANEPPSTRQDLTESAPPPQNFAPPVSPEGDAPARKSEIVREVLTRDRRSGNYFTQGLINGKSVRLMADTGASLVVVPEKIARQIGLKNGPSSQVKTAGGVVTAYETMLDTLTIGRIEIRNVAAMVNPAMQDDFALLGMNALSLLQFGQENDTLVLSYDPAKAETQPAPPPEETVRFRKSVKDCMGDSRTIDQKTLNCLQGG